MEEVCRLNRHTFLFIKLLHQLLHVTHSIDNEHFMNIHFLARYCTFGPQGVYNLSWLLW